MVRHTTVTAVALILFAAFEVYGASMSGTKVLEAGMRRQLLRDGASACSHCTAACPATADSAIIPHASAFARSSLHSLQLGLPFISCNLL